MKKFLVVCIALLYPLSLRAENAYVFNWGSQSPLRAMIPGAGVVIPSVHVWVVNPERLPDVYSVTLRYRSVKTGESRNAVMPACRPMPGVYTLCNFEVDAAEAEATVRGVPFGGVYEQER